MALLELPILENMAKDIAALPEISEKQLANLYGMSVRDVRDVVHSDMFQRKVAETRVSLSEKGELAPLKERLLSLGEVAAASRLLHEIDNENDGTAMSRIAAAKTVLDVKSQKQNQAFIAVELSPDKFRAIFSIGQTPLAAQPDSIYG
jgi:hypothetical protein